MKAVSRERPVPRYQPSVAVRCDGPVRRPDVLRKANAASSPSVVTQSAMAGNGGDNQQREYLTHNSHPGITVDRRSQPPKCGRVLQEKAYSGNRETDSTTIPRAARL